MSGVPALTVSPGLACSSMPAPACTGSSLRARPAPSRHAETPTAKRKELEVIDASLDPVVDRALDYPELVTVVTADHTTPSVGNFLLVHFPQDPFPL